MSLTFFRNFLRSPGQVGAIAPSSQQLAACMVDWFDWASIEAVVEFGPGTGVFTESILGRLQGNAKFFAIERSPDLCKTVKSRCPTAEVVQDTVEHVGELCRQRGIEQVDAVVCGLPWASFSASLQTSCLEALAGVLRPGGQFATFAYWQGMLLPAAHRFRSRLDNYFSEIHRSPTVWWNLPPAFVYRCVR